MGKPRRLGLEFLLSLNDIKLWGSLLSVVPIIPLVATEPSNKIQSMPAAIIFQIPIDKLCLHGVHQFLIPAPFDLNDSSNNVVYVVLTIPHNCIDVNIRVLTPANFYFPVHDDASLLQLFFQMSFDIVRKSFFIFG